MQVQDWKDVGRGKLLGGERVCAYRHGEILCGQGYQQEDDVGERAYGTGQTIEPETRGPSKLMAAVIGSERDRGLEKSINGSSKHIDASGLL